MNRMSAPQPAVAGNPATEGDEVARLDCCAKLSRMAWGG